MRTKILKVGAAAIVLLAVAAVIIWQQRRTKQLIGENAALHQVATIEPLLLESYTGLPERYQNDAKREQEMFLDRIWQGAGHILAGRIVLEAADHVISSRAALRRDGSFCVALYPSRQFVIYAHGYEPLVLTPPTTTNYPIVYYGDIRMTRLPAAELASVKGVIPSNSEISTNEDVTNVRLELDMPPPIWGDWGCEGSSGGFTSTTEERNLGAGPFQFTGLSPTPYRLIVFRKGYVMQSIPVTPSRKDVIDLDEIVLQKAKILVFRYISRTRTSGGDWNEQTDIRSITVTCDGHSGFDFTDKKDGLGNRLALRLTPEGQDVRASFFFYSKTFYDLASIKLEEIGDLTKVEEIVPSLDPQPNALLKSGNCYAFRPRDINGVDVDLLFSVEEK
jgi:hypothetical protein